MIPGDRDFFFLIRLPSIRFADFGMSSVGRSGSGTSVFCLRTPDFGLFSTTSPDQDSSSQNRPSFLFRIFPPDFSFAGNDKPPQPRHQSHPVPSEVHSC